MASSSSPTQKKNSSCAPAANPIYSTVILILSSVLRVFYPALQASLSPHVPNILRDVTVTVIS
jgi:hypothetical protein